MFYIVFLSVVVLAFIFIGYNLVISNDYLCLRLFLLKVENISQADQCHTGVDYTNVEQHSDL
jgi:hypothetical protein